MTSHTLLDEPPPPAGLAQGLWNFRVEPCGDGSRRSAVPPDGIGGEWRTVIKAVAAKQRARRWAS
jgi:hypothetical protein